MDTPSVSRYCPHIVHPNSVQPSMQGWLRVGRFLHGVTTHDARGTRVSHYFITPVPKFPNSSLMTYYVPALGSTSLRLRLSEVYNGLEAGLMALVRRASTYGSLIVLF
jgi:hypothetical protein